MGLLYNCRIDPLVLDDTIPCDPDLVYFEKDILPLLQSNCARSDCHDEQSAQNDVILTNYLDIINTADVEKGDAEDSNLYEVLEDGEMPPDEEDKLSQEQVNLIKDWINQGAKNNRCDNCDTTEISYAMNVYPIIQSRCEGCHSGSNPQGNVILSNYNEIRNLAINGDLIGVIGHEPGFTPMPYNLPKLPACEIDQIITWIEDGSLEF